MSKSEFSKELGRVLGGAVEVRRLHKEQAKGIRGNKREALRDDIANNYAAENDFSEEEKEMLFDELKYPVAKRLRAIGRMSY